MREFWMHPFVIFLAATAVACIAYVTAAEHANRRRDREADRRAEAAHQEALRRTAAGRAQAAKATGRMRRSPANLRVVPYVPPTVTRLADRKPSIHALVERSSLGTPAAKAARASVPDEVAARVVARARELEAERDGRTP